MFAVLCVRLSFHDDVYEQENLIEFWLVTAIRILWMRVHGFVLRLLMKRMMLCSTGSSDMAPVLINIITC